MPERSRPEPEVRRVDAADVDLPMALTVLHRELVPGAEVNVRLAPRPGLGSERIVDLTVGAGFELESPPVQATPMRLRRLLTLPDTVGPDMRVLVCGLNPSIHAAEMGVGFGRSGNRFWPAALAAGLVTVDRDPDRALRNHGLGMTDIVKRATRRAAEITTAEYRTGVARVERLVAWLRPTIVCFVGLGGWRAAVDAAAGAGQQDRLIGGRPVYVMPSTSGLNAHSRLGDLTRHLGIVAQSADRERGQPMAES